MNTILVYGLFDLRCPDVICYVGKTSRPFPEKGHMARVKQHLRGLGSTERLRNWIKETSPQNIGQRVLEIVSASEWRERERYWIEIWREKNPNLLNVRAGGGGDNVSLSEVRRKLTAVRLPDEYVNGLERIAARDYQSVSDVMRRAVRELLEREATGKKK